MHDADEWKLESLFPTKILLLIWKRKENPQLPRGTEGKEKPSRLDRRKGQASDRLCPSVKYNSFTSFLKGCTFHCNKYLFSMSMKIHILQFCSLSARFVKVSRLRGVYLSNFSRIVIEYF